MVSRKDSDNLDNFADTKAQKMRGAWSRYSSKMTYFTCLVKTAKKKTWKYWKPQQIGKK